MKAIVLEVRGGKAALLLENGTTVYRRMDVKPGQSVEVPEESPVVKKHSFHRIATAAAAAIAVVFIGTGYYETALPVSYVTVDVNPSVEYVLNRMDKVISVEALNDDADKVLSKTNEADIRGSSIDEAVTVTEEVMREDNYLKDDGYMLLSVTSDKEGHRNAIEDALDTYIKEKEEQGITCALLETTSDEREAANKLEMSTGRYADMIRILGSSIKNDSAEVAEYRNMSVKELIDSYNDTIKESGSNSKKQNEKEQDDKSDNASSDHSYSIETSGNGSDRDEPSDVNSDRSKQSTNYNRENSFGGNTGNNTPNTTGGNERNKNNTTGGNSGNNTAPGNNKAGSGSDRNKQPANNNTEKPSGGSSGNRNNPTGGNPGNNTPPDNNKAENGSDNSKQPVNDKRDNPAGGNPDRDNPPIDNPGNNTQSYNDPGMNAPQDGVPAGNDTETNFNNINYSPL